jgi:hypothetical protein
MIPAVNAPSSACSGSCSRCRPIIYLLIWFRGTFPRFRYDQLMNIGWKIDPRGHGGGGDQRAAGHDSTSRSTHGVLPVPPMVRLPTLITGNRQPARRRKSRRCARCRPIPNRASGHADAHSHGMGGRYAGTASQFAHFGHGARGSAALGFAHAPAPARRSRALRPVPPAIAPRLPPSSSGPIRNRPQAPAARKSSAMAWKFSMCGPVITGLPNSAGSRMLWPPRARQRAAHEDHVRHGEQPLNSPMESSSSTRGRRHSHCRAPTADVRDARANPACPPPPRSAPACAAPESASGRDARGASSRNAAITTSSSSHPRGGGRHGAGGDPDLLRPHAGEQRSCTGEPSGIARGSKSYLKLPDTRTAVRRRAEREEALADLLRSAPGRHRRRQHGAAKKPAPPAITDECLSEIRPLTSASAAPVRFVSRNRLGQISVSAITTIEGRSVRRTRRTAKT